MASLLRYTGYLGSKGAPIGRLLACSRIPVELLEHPAAAVPMENAFRFGELACRTLGTEHLGAYVGLASLLEDLGPYGEMLQRSLTLHEYLHKGISLFNTLMTGQRLSLSAHGQEVRLNIVTAGGLQLGAYQSHLETLIVTIARLRDAAGMEWSPREVSLAYRAREDLPEIDVFAGSRVIRGSGDTYLTIPRRLMRRRFGGRGVVVPATAEAPRTERPLPEDLGGLVGLELENLLPERWFEIDTVAEILGMSRRSLQRRLAQQGLTYSKVLAETRLRRAVEWLEGTDKSVAEIAFDLGYTDGSNFTRAFRRQTGVSPQTFRDSAKNT